MAEQRNSGGRNSGRNSDRNSNGRDSSPRSGGGRPSNTRGRNSAAGGRDGESRGRAADGTGGAGGYQGKRDGGAKSGYQGKRDGYQGKKDAPGRSAGRPRRTDPVDRTEAQKVYDGPPIPDDISAKDLDRAARFELQSLPEKLQDKVARHLVMAGNLLFEDPELAHKHALAARARALRTGLVREAVGETAYACGNWAEALSEFRAAKRMTGRGIYAPMMADCERALKRPEKALDYDEAKVRAGLDEAGNAELTIVLAGARRDLGQVEAALQLLETEPLGSRSRADWVARLRYAYADTLLAAGRRADAIEWFHRTVAVDGNKLTDAEDRIASLS